jgi:lysophospholipase L1-like esterase
MEWYESEVAALERRHARSEAPRAPVLFYGSSSIRAWETLADDVGDSRAVNLGFGGSTLEACTHYFERLVVPLHPSSLVVYAGENDLGDGRRPSEVMQSFRALLAKVVRDLGTAPFGFIAIKPSPARAPLIGRMREVNEAIRHEIAPFPHVYFVDVFEPMLSAHGRPRPELFLDDGLHLSRAGYELWTAVLRPFRHRIFTE